MAVGTMIEFEDAASGYQAALVEALVHGESVSPRGVETRELGSVTLVSHDPSDCLLTGIGRKLSPTLAAVEALQIVGGFSDPELTVAVAPRYKDFLDNGVFHGAYGPRTMWQVPQMVKRLQKDPSTRRAVVTVWESARDYDEGLHDYPCTKMLTFLVRNGKLRMITQMRSNDLWLGWPYDLFQFTALQRTLARFLGLEVGEYVHQVDSLHLYERDVPAAQELIENWSVTYPRPRFEGGMIDDLDHDDDWHAVQADVYKLCYYPSHVMFETSSETRWFAETMRKWWESQ